ncbi:hypothetical protein [Vibrio sp. Of7-15]|nr:hypothetical protein [Vibrio sp. Of7-15]
MINKIIIFDRIVSCGFVLIIPGRGWDQNDDLFTGGEGVGSY